MFAPALSSRGYIAAGDLANLLVRPLSGATPILLSKACQSYGRPTGLMLCGSCYRERCSEYVNKSSLGDSLITAGGCYLCVCPRPEGVEM